MSCVDKLLYRVLYVDLSSKKFWIEERKDLFEKYLGGVGVAVKLLEEELPKGVDPLAPDNVIVFAVGPLTAMYPLASKTVAVFKSPLTGNYGESHAGGRSAIAIRSAGYGAIVIKGSSDIPVYLVIDSKGVKFRDARALWGMRSAITVSRVIREVEGGAGIRSIMGIGIAGEKLVRYASVMTETYRHFGRLGLGAVFGSKKLKAVMVTGKRTIPVKDKQMYRKVYDEIFKAAVESTAMKKYHDLGTAVNVLSLNKIKALPTRNLKSAEFEKANTISGEHLAETKLGRRVACTHCPVACIHLAALREPYETEPYFYKTVFVSYDYEPIYALGSMLGVGDTDGLLKLMDVVEMYGLDAMSTGVILAWMTEALERGIISEKETLVKLEWGDHQKYIKAVEFIVKQPNEFYKYAALGLDSLAEKYGGQDFALSYGGNPMPGYHTGPAAHIGYLIGARHSHLDTAGYSLDQKLLGKKYPTPEELVDKLVEEECWRQILSSLVVCFFARGIYKPDIVVKALQPLGYTYNVDDLKKLGTEIYREKYRLKVREGFKISKLRIPKRLLETPTPHGLVSEEYVVKALEYFKKKMNIPE